MRTTIREVEQRLRKVEKDLAELKAAMAPDRKEPWYRQIVGTFANDPVHREIVRLGALIRRGKLKS
jgi:hypothetical protein